MYSEQQHYQPREPRQVKSVPKYQKPEDREDSYRDDYQVEQTPNEMVRVIKRLHARNMKSLNDRLIKLRSIRAENPIESAIQVGDIGVFKDVYSNTSLSKIDLKQASSIIKFLTDKI